jgi:hypothetical protein
MFEELLNGTHTNTRTSTREHNRNLFGPHKTRGNLYRNQLLILTIYFLLFYNHSLWCSFISRTG